MLHKTTHSFICSTFGIHTIFTKRASHWQVRRHPHPHTICQCIPIQMQIECSPVMQVKLSLRKSWLRCYKIQRPPSLRPPPIPPRAHINLLIQSPNEVVKLQNEYLTNNYYLDLNFEIPSVYMCCRVLCTCVSLCVYLCKRSTWKLVDCIPNSSVINIEPTIRLQPTTCCFASGAKSLFVLPYSFPLHSIVKLFDY